MVMYQEEAPNSKKSFLTLSLQDVKELFTRFQMRPERYPELLLPILGSRTTAGSLIMPEVNGVKKRFLQLLNDDYFFTEWGHKSHEISCDGTEKILLELSDGEFIEAVFIPSGSRWTLCLSTQVGCGMGCPICHTQKMGLVRQLTVFEILAPIHFFRKIHHRLPDNIVFMGMGEPLDNLSALLEAIEILLHPKIFSFAPRKVTVSTIGFPEKLKELQKQQLKVKITLSVGALTPGIRDRIIPKNREFPLQQTVDFLKASSFFEGVVLAYVLIDGLNCHQSEIDKLAEIALSLGAKVNLIPFNPFSTHSFKPPAEERMGEIWQFLIEKGLSTRLRLTKGVDILAACGQLNSKFTSSRLGSRIQGF